MEFGWDGGRKSAKTAGANGYRDSFDSWVGDARTLKLTNSERSTDIIITTEGKTHFIGALAKDESFAPRRMMTESKIHEDTRILFQASIARAIPDGTTVDIVTGVPIAQHDPRTKEQLIALLSGVHDVEINGTRKRFLVRLVRVAIEGATVYLTLAKEGNGIVRIIDIGSRTVNFATISNGRFVDRLSGTLDYGMEKLAQTDNETAAAQIAGDLSWRWTDPHDQMFLVGGGALRLGNDLQYHFQNVTIPQDSVYANAIAYYEAGERARAK